MAFDTESAGGVGDDFHKLEILFVEVVVQSDGYLERSAEGIIAFTFYLSDTKTSTSTDEWPNKSLCCSR